MKSSRLTGSSMVVALVLFTAATRAQQTTTQEPRPTFRSSVDLVSVAAVVRDHKGRFVRDLKRSDFTILEGGQPRPIVEFHAEQDAPIRVALLFDVSGSMGVGSKLDEARQAARQVLSVLRVNAAPRARDEAAVYSFDTRLQALQGFTADPGAIEDALLCFTSLTAFEEHALGEQFRALAGRCWEARGFSDCWAHVLVAEGSADLAVEPVMNLWDNAPLQVIVEEAGGRFTDLDGRPRADGGSAVTTNGLLHEDVLAAMGRAG